jgi:hypothetical protein
MLGNDNEGAINVPSGIEFQQLDSGRLHTWYGDSNHFEIPLLHHSLRVTLLVFGEKDPKLVVGSLGLRSSRYFLCRLGPVRQSQVPQLEGK